VWLIQEICRLGGRMPDYSGIRRRDFLS